MCTTDMVGPRVVFGSIAAIGIAVALLGIAGVVPLAQAQTTVPCNNLCSLSIGVFTYSTNANLVGGLSVVQMNFSVQGHQETGVGDQLWLNVSHVAGGTTGQIITPLAYYFWFAGNNSNAQIIHTPRTTMSFPQGTTSFNATLAVISSDANPIDTYQFTLSTATFYVSNNGQQIQLCNVPTGGPSCAPPPNNVITPGFTYTVSGMTVAFTDTSSGSISPANSFSWIFGDGTSATTQNATHTYAKAGSYKVTHVSRGVQSSSFQLASPQGTISQNVTINATAPAPCTGQCGVTPPPPASSLNFNAVIGAILFGSIVLGIVGLAAPTRVDLVLVGTFIAVVAGVIVGTVV